MEGEVFAGTNHTMQLTKQLHSFVTPQGAFGTTFLFPNGIVFPRLPSRKFEQSK